MIVKFKVNHEVTGRVYSAGQSHEFETEMARALIANGVAVEHTETMDAESEELAKAGDAQTQTSESEKGEDVTEKTHEPEHVESHSRRGHK